MTSSRPMPVNESGCRLDFSTVFASFAACAKILLKDCRSSNDRDRRRSKDTSGGIRVVAIGCFDSTDMLREDLVTTPSGLEPIGPLVIPIEDDVEV
jgi:hypothetical protein